MNEEKQYNESIRVKNHRIKSLQDAIRRRDNQIDHLRRQVHGLQIRVEKLTTPQVEQPKRIEDIVHDVVSRFHPYTWEALKSPSRKRELVMARHLHMHFIHKYSRMSLISIGTLFGGRDHSSVIHGCKLVRDLRDTDRKYRADFEQMDNYIREMLK